jgi:hypothetical protein
MKNRQIFSALFLLTTAFTANGVTLEVEFTENLTNETEWVYTGKTTTSVDGKLYISSKGGASVISPMFDFAITSVTVVAYHSSDNPVRRLFAVPISGNNISDDMTNLKCEITPRNGKNQDAVACSWNKEEHIQAIEFHMEEGSSGNIYLLSAKILGVSIPYPPENLEAARVGGKQIFIKWRNSDTVAGNKVRVYKTTWRDESFETVKSYDFNAEGFQNKGKNDEITADLLIESYPDFADSTLIYLPTNSVGQIQISKSDEKGVLKHKGFENYNSLCVDMTARKYFTSKKTEENGGTVIKENEDDDTMTVGYEYPAGTTNVFATVNLEKDFKREIIPLNGVPADAPILFNATGNKTNHRVIIDEMKFIKNYSPAGERLDLVQETNTSGSKIRLSNLERNTDYVIRVAAADANGKESESAELRVKTSSQNDSGFYLKVR